MRGAQPLNLGISLHEPCRSLLVFLIEADFTLVETRDLHLDRGELLLRLFAAGSCIGNGCSETLHLSRASFNARPRCIDLTGEVGQSLASVRGGSLGLSYATLFRSERLLRLQSLRLGQRQRITGGFNFAPKIERLFAQRTRLGLAVFGIATAGFLNGLWLQIADPLGGQLQEAVIAFPKSTQSEPGLG